MCVPLSWEVLGIEKLAWNASFFFPSDSFPSLFPPLPPYLPYPFPPLLFPILSPTPFSWHLLFVISSQNSNLAESTVLFSSPIFPLHSREHPAWFSFCFFIGFLAIFYCLSPLSEIYWSKPSSVPEIQFVQIWQILSQNVKWSILSFGLNWSDNIRIWNVNRFQLEFRSAHMVPNTGGCLLGFHETKLPGVILWVA